MMREVVAGCITVLGILLLVAVCADRGIPAALESLAFAVHEVLSWLDHRTMRACCGLADRMRERRNRIEADNRKRRSEVAA